MPTTEAQKALARERNRRYCESHREQIRARSRAAYWADPEKTRKVNLEHQKRYYERHRDEIATRSHAAYLANPDPKRTHSRRYHQTHREQHAAYDKARDHDKQLARYRRYREANMEQIAARREATKDRASEVNKVWYRRRGQFLMRMKTYGLTQEQFEFMLEAQGKSCAICHMPFGETKSDAPHVDHNHTTGKVRGLLCINCNFLIGHCREEPALLVAAGLYLDNAKEVS